jgi:CAAX protease family protein
VLVTAVVVGVVNAVLVERSGSIWPAVIAHGTYNGILFSLAALLS